MTIYSYTWPGADTDPLPSPWTTSVVNGIVNQNGAGAVRVQMDGAAGDLAYAEQPNIDAGDTNLLIPVTRNVSGTDTADLKVQICASGSRAAGETQTGGDAYMAFVRMSFTTLANVSIYKVQGGTAVGQSNELTSLSAPDDIVLEFDRTGGQITFTVWNAAMDTQLGVCSLDDSTSPLGTGYVSFGMEPDTNAAKTIHVGTLDIETDEGVDTTPAAFSFNDVTDAALSTEQVSNAITVTDVDAGEDIAISIIGGDYRINGGSWTNAAGVVQLNDQVEVRHTSSGSYATTVDTQLNIGGIVDTFSSTTIDSPVSIATSPATVASGATGLALTGAGFAGSAVSARIVESGVPDVAITINVSDDSNATIDIPDWDTTAQPFGAGKQLIVTVDGVDSNAVAIEVTPEAGFIGSAIAGPIPSDGSSIYEFTNTAVVAGEDHSKLPSQTDGGQAITWNADGTFSVATAGNHVVSGVQIYDLTTNDWGAPESFNVTQDTVDQDPTVNITSPADGGSVLTGTQITLQATAVDDEDGDISANIQWSSDIDGALGSGASLPVTLSVGSHTITASVQDSASQSGQDQIGFTVTVDQVPTCTIDSPMDGATFTTAQSVTLIGTANDNEDGDISADIEWSSDVDGVLGTGASINTPLSAGSHTITASVQDSAAQPAQDQIALTITAPAANAVAMIYADA